MDISVLGVDLGKNVCSVVGLDAGAGVIRRKDRARHSLLWRRSSSVRCRDGGLLRGSSSRPRVHHHHVRLMSPEYVRPHIKAQNDDRDAEGIAEAATRPTMRFVELKSQGPARHADASSIARPVGRRAAGSDRSVARHSAGARNGRAAGQTELEQFLGVLMDEQGGAGLSLRMIALVGDARAQWAELDRRISAFDAEFVRWAGERGGSAAESLASARPSPRR